MLPTSLRAVYALNSATFQVSSLALLSIVNTRVGIPAEYLPAYGAISFLPYSLRPMFAWFSSWLLSLRDNNDDGSANRNKNRHEKLLFPAYLLASAALVGTTFIPTGGFILCFAFGFVRGIAGAWSDFLIGMSVIEFSKVQEAMFLKENARKSYEHIVSVNTSQSATAKNIGAFVASVGTFIFFSKHNRDLGTKAANTLILGTAMIFLLAALASLKYQFHVSKMLANFNNCYDTIDDCNDEGVLADDTPSAYPPPGTGYELKQTGLENKPDGDAPISPTVDTALPVKEGVSETRADSPDGKNWESVVQVSTLVSFQMLLAVSALQKPIIAVTNQTAWVSVVVIMFVILVVTVYLGYRYEQHQKLADSSLSEKQNGKNHSQPDRLPHRQLNLYFLLRYSMPIAGFLMYSYLYTVFQSEPLFLQLLSILKSAIGSLSTFFYEKYVSPYCHSGWPLIGVIAFLDIVMGLVALLDVWVVRAVRENEVDGEYSIDNKLRWLVGAVGLIKYFFAELDYMPALVLSTTNIYTDNEMCSDYGDDDKMPTSTTDGYSNDHIEVTSLSNASSLKLHSCNEEDNSTFESPPEERRANQVPVISAGMQYASFLSCIDFGAQIGDWITVPIIASIGITRENHWDHLDQFVILCSIFRMARVVFLWLIFPSNPPQIGR